MNRISPKRKASTKLGFNSTFAVGPRKPKKVMTVEELKASGLLKKASQVGGKSERSKAMKQADKWFSMFIRLRDSDENGMAKCVTCSHRDHWLYQQCGHWISRGEHATRYDEKNCSLQCSGCNGPKGGRAFDHVRAIEARHGAGTRDALELKVMRWRKSNASYKSADLWIIAKNYRERVEWIKQHEPGKFK